MGELAEVSSVADLVVDDSLLVVAFASSDGEIVNQHFGSSSGFHVYGISGSEAIPLSKKTFGIEKKDGNEDKLKPKLAWLNGCDLVYCGSVGGSATKQLVMMGANPVMVKEGPEIEELIEKLQAELNGTLSPMLARVLKQKVARDESRFDEMANDGWDE